jgi:hypothetical protein
MKWGLRTSTQGEEEAALARVQQSPRIQKTKRSLRISAARVQQKHAGEKGVFDCGFVA